MDIVTAAEALVFHSSSPVSKKTLMKTLKTSADEIEGAIEKIREKYKDSGFVLLDDGEAVSFAVNPAVSGLFKEEQKKQNEPLSQAARETLAIIAYAGPISRLDLDIIRGVNSRYSTDRLVQRGYVQVTRESQETALLSVTVDFLSSFNITEASMLPDYEERRQHILENLEFIRQKIKESESKF